jgi:hypothetical protein
MAITFLYTPIAPTHDRLTYRLDVTVTAGDTGPATDSTLTNAQLVADSNGTLESFFANTAAASANAALAAYFASCQATVTQTDGGLIFPATHTPAILNLRPVSSAGFIGFDVDFGLNAATDDIYTFILDFVFRYINLGYPPNH